MIIIICGDRDKTTNHIISECSKLAQKEYKTRHDWVEQGDPAETVSDADNITQIHHIKVESQLHSLEQATRGIDIYVNANKIEYVCLKKKGRHLHSRRFTYLSQIIVSYHLHDPLSPFVIIVRRSQQVFHPTCHIGIELLLIGSSWSSYLCTST